MSGTHRRLAGKLLSLLLFSLFVNLIFYPPASPFPLSCGQGQDSSGFAYSLSFARSRKWRHWALWEDKLSLVSGSLGDFAFCFTTNSNTGPKLHLFKSFAAFAFGPWHFPTQKFRSVHKTLWSQVDAWFLAFRLSSSVLSTWLLNTLSFWNLKRCVFAFSVHYLLPFFLFFFPPFVHPSQALQSSAPKPFSKLPALCFLWPQNLSCSFGSISSGLSEGCCWVRDRQREWMGPLSIACEGRLNIW